MKTIILYIIVGIIILAASCAKHLDQEYAVKELIHNYDKVSETMENFESTKFYKDSILNSINPDTLWSKYFAVFKDNYFIEKSKYWLGKRYYQQYIDIDGVKAYTISAINSSNPSEILEFHFKKVDDKWRLVNIDYRTSHIK